jgi:hypothetical protein
MGLTGVAVVEGHELILAADHHTLRCTQGGQDAAPSISFWKSYIQHGESFAATLPLGAAEEFLPSNHSLSVYSVRMVYERLTKAR